MKKYTELELLNIYAAFVEAHQINIAEDYEQWLNVAFACASESKNTSCNFSRATAGDTEPLII